ncbi:MAG: FkbM family methyltransferase [Burkholderiales bacterium]
MSIIKSIAVWGISKGLQLPQSQLDRMSELSFLRRLLDQLQVDCVLDVGANRGQFARELRGIGYEGRLISFEPIASEFSVLEKRFEDDPKWRGYQIALGSKSESMSITIPKLTVMSSLLETEVAEKGTRKETVEVKRLDNVLPALVTEFGVSRIFLKMDTQGYDLEVFKGASGCIDMIQGIQSELSVQPLYKNMPHYLEALDAYEGAGFDLYNLSVVNRIASGGLLELNCFMRRTR